MAKPKCEIDYDEQGHMFLKLSKPKGKITVQECREALFDNASCYELHMIPVWCTDEYPASDGGDVVELWSYDNKRYHENTVDELRKVVNTEWERLQK